MGKISRNPSTALFPVPVVLVTSVGKDGRPNVFTAAWTGTINSVPPMVYVSARPATLSNSLIKQSGEFVINIPGADLAWETDYCGCVSGRDRDKFEETGLTPIPAERVRAPLIKECPVNIECRVTQTLKPGGHDMFLGEILLVHYSEEYLDDNGRPDFGRIRPFTYCNKDYLVATDKIGRHGFSLKKPRP